MSDSFDPEALLAQALEMQQRLMEAQAEAASETVEGSAGGGAVRVTMTGAGEVTAVRLDPSVVVADEVEMLEDLILAALRDASSQVAALADQQMDIGGLGDLFGGGSGLGALFGGAQGEILDVDEAPPGQLPPGAERS